MGARCTIENVSESYRTGAVQRHMEALIRLAIQWARERPGERAVALVAEGDVREAPIWRLAEGEYVLRGEDGSVALVVDRETAKHYIVGTSIQVLEHLVDEGSGPVRELPLVHVAVRGVRAGGIKYKVPPETWNHD